MVDFCGSSSQIIAKRKKVARCRVCSPLLRKCECTAEVLASVSRAAASNARNVSLSVFGQKRQSSPVPSSHELLLASLEQWGWNQEVKPVSWSSVLLMLELFNLSWLKLNLINRHMIC